MPYLNLADTSLFYRERGAGPMAVFLHAFLLDHSLWSDQLSGSLAERRCVAPDLRGFGRSDPISAETLDLDVYADDAAVIIDQLEGGRADLVGFSIGATISVLVAARHPARVRSLVLMSPTLTRQMTPQQREYLEGNAHKAVFEPRQTLFLQFNDYIFGPSGGRATLGARARYKAMLEATRADMLVATFRTMQVQPDRTELLASIQVPVLIVVGELDIISVPEAHHIAGRFPRGQVAVIPDAGRITCIENPGAFNTALSRFWNESA